MKRLTKMLGVVVITLIIGLFTNAFADGTMTINVTVTGTSAQAYWNAVNGATTYAVTLIDNSTSPLQVKAINTNSTSYTFTGLTPGDKYSVYVGAFSTLPSLRSVTGFFLTGTLTFEIIAYGSANFTIPSSGGGSGTGTSGSTGGTG